MKNDCYVMTCDDLFLKLIFVEQTFYIYIHFNLVICSHLWQDRKIF